MKTIAIIVVALGVGGCDKHIAINYGPDKIMWIPGYHLTLEGTNRILEAHVTENEIGFRDDGVVVWRKRP